MVKNSLVQEGPYLQITLPARNASRRVACSGSAHLEASQPYAEESQTQRECAAAHEVLRRIEQDNEALTIGTITSNGEPVTQEMILGVQAFQEFREKEDIAGAYEGVWDMDLDLKGVNERCLGVTDFRCYKAATNTAYILDYSFGHIPVDIKDNWQLVEYARGYFDELQNYGDWCALQEEYLPVDILKHQVEFNFVLAVIQPRAYSAQGAVKLIRLTSGEIAGMWDRLAKAEAAALNPAALCTPSPECKGCSARAACGALRTASLTTLEIAQENKPMNLPSEALGNELRILKWAEDILRARLSALELQAFGLIRQGKRVPGYAIGEGQGSKSWSVPKDAVVQYAEIMGLPSMINKVPITAIQARDRLLTGELLGLSINKRNPAQPADAAKLARLSKWVESHTKEFAGAAKLVPAEVQEEDIKKLFNIK